MSKSQVKPPPPLAIPPKPKPKPTAPHNHNHSHTHNHNHNHNHNNKVIWDCGSTLYDSVELDSFRKQLDSAILNSSRTLSLPRLPSHHHRAPPPPPPKKPSSKLSRSFHKLLNSVFKKNPSSLNHNYHSSTPDPCFFDSPPLSYDGDNILGGASASASGGQYYLVYDEKPPNKNGLTSIPEAAEVNISPDFGSSSLVRKTMSARFSSPPPPIHSHLLHPTLSIN